MRACLLRFDGIYYKRFYRSIATTLEETAVIAVGLGHWEAGRLKLVHEQNVARSKGRGGLEDQ